MYDLIGDIHGHADALERLLEKLDYSRVNGVWKHPTHKTIFVGDYIDRGPKIRETLRLVHDMAEERNAIALMGNHEYNALAYAYQLPGGTFLRQHNHTHTKQHEATPDQFRGHEKEWQYYLEWFSRMPLYLEQDGLRAVHACWDDEHIQWLRDEGHSSMNADLLLASYQKHSNAYNVINQMLKGKELAIPEEYAWPDKDGHMRTENRLKWWATGKSFYGELLFDCPDELRDHPFSPDAQTLYYPEDAPPVFIGHYWLNDKMPIIQSMNVACLDYSIAKGGSLVAYRWSGEAELDSNNFVCVHSEV